MTVAEQCVQTVDSRGAHGGGGGAHSSLTDTVCSCSVESAAAAAVEVVWRGAPHRRAAPDSLSPLPDNADNAAAFTDTCVQPLPRVYIPYKVKEDTLLVL